MSRTVAFALALAGTLTTVNHAQQKPSAVADLKTTAESSDFKSTSSYDDVVKFMKAVDAASPNITYTTYGKTYEGREMPMAVVGTGLKGTTPAAIRAITKLRVHIQGNIHAGEVEGKESAQILLREFAAGQHADWLRSMVFLITPIFNADGNERFSMTSRGRQNGPINGQGTRANAQSLNINRDFMKLETPEAQAFAKLFVDYDPHVSYDLHTSDGSTTAYHLTYSPPLNPNTFEPIVQMLRDEWFPFVTKSIKAKHGWDTFYYGNASNPGGRGGGRGRGGEAAAGRGAGDGRGVGGGDGRAAGAGAVAGGARGGANIARGIGEPTGLPPTPDVVGAPAPQAPAGPRAWSTFEHVPRFHNNYVGLRNRFALLSEAYAYATFEDRIKATNYFLEESLTFAHANADRIKQAVAAADKAALVGLEQGTRAQIKRGGMIDILMGEVEDEKNPNNGAVMNRRKDVSRVEPMVDMLWFEPTSRETVAAEYYLPATATRAIELLRKHGVQLRQVKQPVSGVEQFTITANTARAANPNSIDTGTHALRALEGSWAAAEGVTVPAGSYAIAMNQPLARLAFYLLAPTSDDGLTNWNYLDDLLGEGVRVYPILRRK